MQTDCRQTDYSNQYQSVATTNVSYRNSSTTSIFYKIPHKRASHRSTLTLQSHKAM